MRIEGNNQHDSLMSERVGHSERYEFGTAVDIPTVLETSHIEFLDVDETRAIVLFGDAILDVNSSEKPLAAARTLDVRVFEPPASVELTESEILSDLLTQFVDRVAETGDTTASRLD